MGLITEIAMNDTAPDSIDGTLFLDSSHPFNLGSDQLIYIS